MVVKIINRKDLHTEHLGVIKNLPEVGRNIEFFCKDHDILLFKTSEIQRISRPTRSNVMEVRTKNSTYYISLV